MPPERVGGLDGVAAMDRHDRRPIGRDHVDPLMAAPSGTWPAERIHERHETLHRTDRDRARRCWRERTAPTTTRRRQSDLLLGRQLVLVLAIQLVDGGLKVSELGVQVRSAVSATPRPHRPVSALRGSGVRVRAEGARPGPRPRWPGPRRPARCWSRNGVGPRSPLTNPSREARRSWRCRRRCRPNAPERPASSARGPAGLGANRSGPAPRGPRPAPKRRRSRSAATAG